ncbi:hypothetical protein FQA39_LY11220 [Lamprigera yunnana]|nr:hypothetical protein FQA39_LY11220 [Lamprigera yunnana]
MCSKVLFVIIVIFGELNYIISQESAQYLQSAIWNLENKINEDQSRRRMDDFQVKPLDVKKPQKVPMLSLTKGELASLYASAVAGQQYIKDVDSDSPFSNTVIHEIDDDTEPSLHSSKPDSINEENDGYYYYYYPLNSFMDTSHAHELLKPHQHHIETEKPGALYHAHTHQHNVHITTTKSILDHDKKKGLEPLFMAVSSFIGMAVMFVLSILFIPKFGWSKSREVKRESSPELTNIIQVVFKAIDGDDCSERVVCEMGKTAKAFNVHNNRFLKLFRRLSPTTIGWYIDRIEKYSNKNIKCAAIQCRRKNIPKPKKNHKH